MSQFCPSTPNESFLDVVARDFEDNSDLYWHNVRNFTQHGKSLTVGREGIYDRKSMLWKLA